MRRLRWMPALGIGFWVDAVAVCLAQGGELADLRTGVADDGSLIAIGNDDDDWILSNGPASVGPYPRPATVTNTDGAWQVIAGTRWISLNASHTGPNGTYIYERTFEVPSATIDLQITGTARSDNQASVLVNGAKVASLASGSFTGAETSISTAWMTCGGATSQTIRVDVVEGGFGTGLDVGASVNGTPTPGAVLVDLHTGVANDCSLLDAGQPDDDWMLVSGPESVGPFPRPATVVNAASAWRTIGGTSWLSANETISTPAGTYVFENTFDLPANLRAPRLLGYIRTDNQATVRLNGTAIASVADGAWAGAETVLDTSDSALFLFGTNILRIEVTEPLHTCGMDLGAVVVDEAAGIPAISDWGLILTGLLLAIAGSVVLRRVSIERGRAYGASHAPPNGNLPC